MTHVTASKNLDKIADKRALFPGTFDPITLGHDDLIKRALNIVDEVVIGVSTADGKKPLLSAEQRMNLIKDIYKDNDRIKVVPMQGLLVDFVASREIDIVIRGLRNAHDMVYESEMLSMNRVLGEVSNIVYETILLYPSDSVRYISSTRVREVALLQGDISLFVLPQVAELVKGVVKNGSNNNG